MAVKLGNLLDKEARTTLDNLIKKSNTISELSLLKKDPKGLKTTEMEKELSKQQSVASLFEKSKRIIQSLDISRQNLQYYADLCTYYDTYQLQQFSQRKSRLCMICLIWQRVIKLNNHLITFLIHKIKYFETDAKSYADYCILEAKISIDEDKKLASKMLKIVHDNSVEDSEIRPKCYDVVSKERFESFTNNLAKPNLDPLRYEWMYYSNENATIKRNLRAIFFALSFNCEKNKPLKDAVSFMKEYLSTSNKTKDPEAQTVPLDFLPKGTLKYLAYKKSVLIQQKPKKHKNIKYVDIKRYEMALYIAIANGLNSGSIFVPDSVHYRSLEDELISLQNWQNEGDKILNGLSDCINTLPITKILELLEQDLTGLYKNVNKRIKSGENKDIKIDEEKLTWKLPYKKEEDGVENPFYEKFTTVGIANVIDYTSSNTNFYNSLDHILNKGSKSKAQPAHIKAFLVSQGEGIGHKKIAESSDVSLKNLIDIEGKFIRVDSLIEAGNIIIDKMSQLSIFQHYNLSDYGIHASLDGQN